MSQDAAPKPPWHLIDTVLVDLDGTLLDLAFDNWFWLEHVPRAYALARGLEPAEARAQLVPRYKTHEVAELEVGARAPTRL